jgi:hypothetical protein
MKKFSVYILLVAVAIGCKNKNIPDVSNVKVDVTVQRFEKDFFAIDTTNIDASLQQLHQKYPTFLQDFVFNILALPPQPDSGVAVNRGVVAFIKSYKSVKDSADIIYPSFDDVQKDVKRGLQFVKYYFPTYRVPNKIVTFIGPLNSYGNILTTDALAVGLQLYMGSNYSLYQSDAGQEMYPTYISRRFKKEYIPVNCIKTIVDDMYPNNSAGKPLIDQMIEAGKRLYLLDRLMPEAEDTLKTGYTKNQLQGSLENEQLIWSYFVQNDLLFATDPAITKDYMNDAPNTTALGPASPGFIGQFVGWRIVQKWMDKNDKVTLDKLMQTNPRTIFEQAKYKP